MDWSAKLQKPKTSMVAYSLLTSKVFSIISLSVEAMQGRVEDRTVILTNSGTMKVPQLDFSECSWANIEVSKVKLDVVCVPIDDPKSTVYTWYMAGSAETRRVETLLKRSVSLHKKVFSP